MESIFSSENEMQKWLSEALDDIDGLAEIISNLDDLESLETTTLADKKILDSYKRCIGSLYLNETISENENISVNSNDILKPDFILYAPETQSIVIVELKNLRNATRQAGTELAAYSCAIKSSLPFISNSDIVCVIVSTEWPTLLKHYIFEQIFWHGKNVICLEPHMENEDIKLRLLDISILSQNDELIKISANHIGGYHLCLYDNKKDKTYQDKYLPQMQAALHAMAVCGNSKNTHGFAFLWKDDCEIGLATYAITVLNFAPFQALERFLQVDGKLPDIAIRLMKLTREHDPSGHGNSITEITDCCKPFLKNICNPQPEDFTTWPNLRKVMNNATQLVAFEGWGMFGELFADKLAREYESGKINCSLTSADLGLAVVNELIDENYEFVDLADVDDLYFDWEFRRSEQTIWSEATAIRKVLEKHRESLQELESFPLGACGMASVLLGMWLEDKGIKGIEYVPGNHEEMKSHAWLEYNGLIIDITADRFPSENMPHVFVNLDRSFHDRFDEQPRYSVLLNNSPLEQSNYKAMKKILDI